MLGHKIHNCIAILIQYDFCFNSPKKGVFVVKKEKQPNVLAKKRLSGNPQQMKKIPKPQSSSSMSPTVAITVSPRLMDVVQNMLTSSHGSMTSVVAPPIQSVISLSSIPTSTITTNPSVFSTPIVNVKPPGELSQKMAFKQAALSPGSTVNVGRAAAVSSVLTSNHITSSSSAGHRLITTKLSSVVLSPPIVSIAKLTQGLPAFAKPQSTFVSPSRTSILNPLSYAKVSAPFPIGQTDRPFSTKISQVSKNLIATSSSLTTTGTNIQPKPFASHPQVCFPSAAPYVQFTKSFVNIVQPKVSRDQPANISPQINLYPGLSRSETVICSPKVKPNNLPHAEHLKNDNVPVGDLVRSPVEQIFEEHSYLKTGTSSISSSNTPSMTQNQKKL